MKKLLAICSFLLFSASTFAYRIEWGRKVTISEPVYENLYIAGGDVIINAPVYGDLIIAAGTIHINDTVSKDILLAGGRVTFNGYVGEDIRCAGGDLYILKDVKGDVLIGGGTVTITKGVVIGNLIMSGGDVTIDGNVAGNIKGAFGEVTLNGNVMKDMDCRAGEITINGSVQGQAKLAATDEIIIGDDASFSSDVYYWVPKNKSVDFKQSLKNGKAVFDASLRIRYGHWYYLGFAGLVGLLSYLGMVVVTIILLQYLFSKTFNKAGASAYQHPLRSLGVGFLFCIAVPVIAILALITVVGIPVGVFLLISYAALIILATSITSIVAANWLNNLGSMNWNFWKMVFYTFWIFILLKLLTFTPTIGWLLTIILVCTAFGAILLNVKWRKKEAAVAIA